MSSHSSVYFRLIVSIVAIDTESKILTTRILLKALFLLHSRTVFLFDFSQMFKTSLNLSEAV